MAETLNKTGIVAGVTEFALALASGYDFVQLVVKRNGGVLFTIRNAAMGGSGITTDTDSVNVTLDAGKVAQLTAGTVYELYAWTEEDKRAILRLVGSIEKSGVIPTPTGQVSRGNLYAFTGTTLPTVDSESDFTEVGDLVYHNGDVKVRTSTAFQGIASGGGKPIQLHKANGDIIGYDNDYVLEEGTGTPLSHGLKDALTAAVSGDSVHLRRDVYDIGQFIATGKTGIYINCEPGCEINGSNTDGTISDGGVEAVFSITGFPKITNSNGFNKRIVLTNANSRVNDFWWEFEAVITFNSSGFLADNSYLIKNTLGDNPRYTRSDVGKYYIYFSSDITGTTSTNRALAYVSPNFRYDYTDYPNKGLYKQIIMVTTGFVEIISLNHQDTPHDFFSGRVYIRQTPNVEM